MMIYKRSNSNHSNMKSPSRTSLFFERSPTGKIRKYVVNKMILPNWIPALKHSIFSLRLPRSHPPNCSAPQWTLFSSGNRHFLQHLPRTKTSTWTFQKAWTRFAPSVNWRFPNIATSPRKSVWVNSRCRRRGKVCVDKIRHRADQRIPDLLSKLVPNGYHDFRRPSAGPPWLLRICCGGDLVRLTLNPLIQFVVFCERKTDAGPSEIQEDNLKSHSYLNWIL